MAGVGGGWVAGIREVWGGGCGRDIEWRAA